MPTITLKLELHRLTMAKQEMYQKDDRNQYGVCKLTLASSQREPGNQQDFQKVFRREVPVCEPQPNDPGCRKRNTNKPGYSRKCGVRLTIRT